MKCLHKFFNRVNISWVNIIWDTHYSNSLPSTKPVGSFWWKDILKVQDSFKEIAQVEIGNGKSTLLWHDRWNGQRLSEKFPELCLLPLSRSLTFIKLGWLLRMKCSISLSLLKRSNNFSHFRTPSIIYSCLITMIFGDAVPLPIGFLLRRSMLT
jgi:hypothetical protein